MVSNSRSVSVIVFLLISTLISVDNCYSQQYDYFKLLHGTYLGNSSSTRHVVTAVGLDNTGNILVCGWGNGIPTTIGTYQPQNAGEWDGFICKLSADLSTLIWGTYIGGISNDRIDDMSIGSDGSIYFIASGGVDFPSTNSVDSLYRAQGNGVAVCKLSADGSQLIYSRFIGVYGATSIYPIDYLPLSGLSITISPQNEVFVAGVASTNPNLFFKTSNAYQSTIAGSTDIFFTKLSSTGTILYSTYFGGNGQDYAGRLCYTNGKVYLCGITTSSNFPLATGKSYSSPGDCFVMSWNDGATPTPNTVYLFGSSSTDYCKSICYNQNT
ncbi:MAG: hypothetical protein JNJ85_11260, partial [Candidatus Kapabacteria bacterium]|nr:hypothetical protein [Candidatus Kapabacteria bacterium]